MFRFKVVYISYYHSHIDYLNVYFYKKLLVRHEIAFLVLPPAGGYRVPLVLTEIIEPSLFSKFFVRCLPPLLQAMTAPMTW